MCALEAEMRMMSYTKHAKWYCGVTTALGRGGRLRAAVFVLTPHARRFIEFRDYRKPEDRRRRCAATILKMYGDEVWYRRPRLIVCRHREVSDLLRTDAPERLSVRTNRNARKFAVADRIFDEHVARTRWSRPARGPDGSFPDAV
jgi:hypothetical protein